MKSIIKIVREKLLFLLFFFELIKKFFSYVKLVIPFRVYSWFMNSILYNCFLYNNIPRLKQNIIYNRLIIYIILHCNLKIDKNLTNIQWMLIVNPYYWHLFLKILWIRYI